MRWLIPWALFVVIAPAAADPFAAPPASPEALEARWIEAHASGDAIAAYNLFDWHGVTHGTRQIIRSMIDRDLGERMLRTWLIDPDQEGMTLPPPTPGFVTNLVSDWVLVAEYEAADGSRHMSLHRIGERDGGWRIALPIPNVAP